MVEDEGPTCQSEKQIRIKIDVDNAGREFNFQLARLAFRLPTGVDGYRMCVIIHYNSKGRILEKVY